jgi:hypothetical protein
MTSTRAAGTARALQPSGLLIAAHRHERSLDEGDGVRIFGLTRGFHVCHHTFSCYLTYKEKTMMNHIEREHIPTDRRPLGYWLRAIEGPLRDSMREAFATFGVSRREWRTLTTLHAGAASAAEVEAGLPPRRHGHGHGPGAERRSPEQVLDGFVARGWAVLDGGSYALTAEGERIHDAVLTNVQGVRAAVTAGIPDADYATTMATLERIAQNVGWEPGQRPVRPGRGRGHGPLKHARA